MPNQDGTGPQGKGPKTGRGMGKCGQKTNSSKLQQQGRGMGMGMRRGYGKGQKPQQNDEVK